MKSVPLFLMIASCCAAAACASSSTPGPDPAAVGADSGVRLVTTLNAVNSRVFGTAEVSPTGADRSRVVISIRGAPLNAELPWEIRAGQCGEGGPALGLEAVYRVISARSDGTGELSVTVPMTVPSAPVHSVNVLASRADRDRVVSCGVLSTAVR